MTADDLVYMDDWTMADLQKITAIVEDSAKIAKDSMAQVPAIDASIQELEKSLKKCMSFVVVTNEQWRRRRWRLIGSSGRSRILKYVSQFILENLLPTLLVNKRIFDTRFK